MAKSKKNAPSEDLSNDSIPDKTTSKLRRLVIQNFRCIGETEVSIDLDDIVVLVGPNNAGKSTVLRAYEIITASSAPKLTAEDFHECNPSIPVTMELHTAVGDDLPGNRWVQVIDGENMCASGGPGLPRESREKDKGGTLTCLNGLRTGFLGVRQTLRSLGALRLTGSKLSPTPPNR